ncbi:hypothetical protein LINPERHAP1_LOCUS43501, partial [Linum perenne]
MSYAKKIVWIVFQIVVYYLSKLVSFLKTINTCQFNLEKIKEVSKEIAVFLGKEFLYCDYILSWTL